jgi:hypothetical protein
MAHTVGETFRFLCYLGGTIHHCRRDRLRRRARPSHVSGKVR